MENQVVNIVWLRVATYRWLGIGRHYYGDLICGEKEVPLYRQLNAAEAKRISATEPGLYEEGSEYPGFILRCQLETRAKEVWREEFPEATLLISGRAYYAEPQRALDGPPELVDQINKAHRRCDDLGWHDGGHRKEVRTLCDWWDTEILGLTIDD